VHAELCFDLAQMQPARRHALHSLPLEPVRKWTVDDDFLRLASPCPAGLAAALAPQ
jgi:hypothetical protein